MPNAIQPRARDPLTLAVVMTLLVAVSLAAFLADWATTGQSIL